VTEDEAKKLFQTFKDLGKNCKWITPTMVAHTNMWFFYSEDRHEYKSKKDKYLHRLGFIEKPEMKLLRVVTMFMRNDEVIVSTKEVSDGINEYVYSTMEEYPPKKLEDFIK
jgi:hypothetical protein